MLCGPFVFHTQFHYTLLNIYHFVVYSFHINGSLILIIYAKSSQNGMLCFSSLLLCEYSEEGAASHGETDYLFKYGYGHVI